MILQRCYLMGGIWPRLWAGRCVLIPYALRANDVDLPEIHFPEINGL